MYITIVQSIRNIEDKVESLDGESRQITYHQIHSNVDRILSEKGINAVLQSELAPVLKQPGEQRTYQMFYRQRQEEKRLRGDEPFSHDVHVVVRFNDDFQLMKNRINTMKNRYLLAKTPMANPNLFSLARNHSFNQRKSYISS